MNKSYNRIIDVLIEARIDQINEAGRLKKAIAGAALATCIGPACTPKEQKPKYSDVMKGAAQVATDTEGQGDRLRRNRIGRRLRPGTKPGQQGGPYSKDIVDAPSNKDK